MLKEKAEKIGYRVFIRFNIPQKNSEGEQIQVGAWRRLLPGVEPRHDEIIQIRTPRRAIAQDGCYKTKVDITMYWKRWAYKKKKTPLTMRS